jgi:putative addiction module antidote
MNKPRQHSRSVKLVAVGNSTGVVIPKDMFARLRFDRGYTLYPVETAGGIELRRRDPEVEQQIEVARHVMRGRHDALHELA